MERNLRVDGARVCVEARLRWHPGYFNPDSSRRSLLRSLSDQTPSPTCIEGLIHESVFLKGSLVAPGTGYLSASSSSSLHLSRLSHSTCVSDSDAPSSDASASGDKLKKRRRYRKRRSLIRRQCTQTKSPSTEAKVGQAESPSAVYCEEWIYNTTNQPVINKRLTIAGCLPIGQDDGEMFDRRRHSLQDDVGTTSQKTSSWLDVWHSLLKLTPKPKKKTSQPVEIEIHPSGTSRSALPSISEADHGCVQSETQSTTSSYNSLAYLNLVTSSASSSLNSLLSACHDQSNPTNQEVCLDSFTGFGIFVLHVVLFF